MLLQAASTPSAYQATDTSMPSANAQSPSTGAYQGSDMQTQANSQQAPTFGLVGLDFLLGVPVDWHPTAAIA